MSIRHRRGDEALARGLAALILLAGFCALSPVARAGQPSPSGDAVDPGAPGEPAAEGWKAGVARVDITPREAIWLSGYAHRRRPSQGVLHALWAKALLLEDAGGRRAMLVTLDLIGLDADTSARMRDGLARALELDPAAVVLACSHTHTGPVVGRNLRPMYELSEAEWQKIERYTDHLVELVVDLGRKASAALGPARLSHGLGSASFAVNRRENVEGQVPQLRAAGGLRGPVDHDVPVLCVHDDAKGLRAVVFGYACHATVLNGFEISGDYPGFAQLELQRRFPGVQAMFWAGCGADQNPLPRRSVQRAQEGGEQLAAAVAAVVDGARAPLNASLETDAGVIALPFQDASLEAYPYPIKVWHLGALDWVFLGGEVVVDYGLRLKDELGQGGRTAWICAYADDVMAYLPSERVLREGGYEGGDSMRYYGLSAPWAAGLEERIVSEVRRQCGRPARSPASSVATFALDLTPPLGSALCDGLVPPAASIDDPLEARGLVLYCQGQAPIVLCALDWVGVGNGGHDEFRRSIADAVGTSTDRVQVHSLHPHDAPGCDFEAARLLEEHGLAEAMFPVDFAREAIARVAEAAARAPRRSVDAMGHGRAPVSRVASNRRILGADGKVALVRFSRCTDAEAVAAPEGLIDPDLQCWTLSDGDRALVCATYYATHPQSHYGQGAVSGDFVARARRLRQEALPEVFHVHFDGASGNVAAGKYNDGRAERREELAQRLADGMRRAWEKVQPRPLGPQPWRLQVEPLHLPLRDLLADPVRMRAALANPALPLRERIRAARDLAFARRVQAGRSIPCAALHLSPAAGRPLSILHLPGELFVEYQLAARQRATDREVCVAAYGDYGPGYIGTAIAYQQGGYETGVVSRVGPGSEIELMRVLDVLLR